jgi:Fic family protein
LPPELDWNETLTNALSRANFLLGKLAHEGSTLQNPHILTHPFITKEAVLSSQIEGTQTSLSEIFAAERNINIKQNPDDLPADFPRISIDTKFYHKTL